MPDLFDNDPAPNPSKPRYSINGSAEGGTTADGLQRFTLDSVLRGMMEVSRKFQVDMWLARHTERHIMPILHRVMRVVRDEYADAVTYGGGVYAVGYCVGGRYVLLLGAEKQDPLWTGAGADAAAVADAESVATPANDGTGSLIKAGAVAHVAQAMASDFATLATPVSFVCVENDPLFSQELRVAAEETMAVRELEHQVAVYPGVPHGELY